MQNFAFALVHVPGETQKVVGALSRALLNCGEANLQLLLFSELDSVSSSASQYRVVPEDEDEKKRSLFNGCHNSTQHSQ